MSQNVLMYNGPVTRCIGNEEPLISGIHYYVANNQLSASGHDPLRYTYGNMNERVLLTPEEGRIGNDYDSFIGWCSQKVTNMHNKKCTVHSGRL